MKAGLAAAHCSSNFICVCSSPPRWFSWSPSLIELRNNVLWFSKKEPSVCFDFQYFQYILSCYFPSFSVCCLGDTEHSLCCSHLWHRSLMSCAQNSSHTCLNNLWLIRIWFYCVFFELFNARFIASFLCYILPYLFWVFFVYVPPLSSCFFPFLLLQLILLQLSHCVCSP